MAVTLDKQHQLSEPFCTPKELKEVCNLLRRPSVYPVVNLKSGARVNNVLLMAEHHMSTILPNRYNRIYEPYWNRLKEVFQAIQTL